ncbi:unnamed protein product, partial [Strongylus vulgaris]
PFEATCTNLGDIGQVVIVALVVLLRNHLARHPEIFTPVAIAAPIQLVHRKTGDDHQHAEAARHVRAVRQEQERRESRDGRENRATGNGRDKPESRESPRTEVVTTETTKCPSPPKMSDSIISTGLGSTTSSTNSLITGGSSQASLNTSSGPWKSKLTNIKNSFLGTPRFHRRKMSNGTAESDGEDSHMIDTSDLVKKSWFGSLTSSISVERDDTHCVPVQGKTLNAIKAELIRAFLTVDIVSSPQQVVVMAGESPTYVVQFGLCEGSSVLSNICRQFCKVLLNSGKSSVTFT